VCPLVPEDPSPKPKSAPELDAFGDAVGRLGQDIGRLAKNSRRVDRLAALGTVAGLLAHELNNVLTPTVGYGKAALRRPDDRELAEKALRRCVESAERATEIVRTVLDLARGAEVSGTARSDVRAVVEGELEATELADGPPVMIDVPSELRVMMAPERLARIVQNLVSNARRAMEGRSGGVRIIGRPCSTGNAVVLTVEDDGPGLPDHIAATVFEPFVTDGSVSGSGLGLTLCRELVRDAGGAIRAERSASGGARFVVELPADGVSRAA
jgi:signal transduction histidine kinase